jgi:phosphohistidine phosphatase
MLLIFIRHAIAARLGERIANDRERPLTPQGEQRFRLAARALARIAPRPIAILTSPLLRARQTADIAAQAWGGPEPKALAALTGGDWPALRRALAHYGSEETVVLVGHENWISEVTARLLGSKSARAFGYRKGGIAAIETDSAKPGRGRLLWFIPPRVWVRTYRAS